MLKLFNNFKSLDALNNALTEALTSYLVATKKDKVLLLLSGGSAFNLYEVIAKKLNGIETKFPLLQVTMLDERYDSLNSNFLEFSKTTLFKELVSKKAALFGIEEYETKPEILAKVLDLRLKEYINQGYKLTSIIGMGPDGHISGIFPYPEDNQYFEKEFVNTDNLAVYYDAHDKNEFSKRITTTIPFLKAIDKSYCYIIGDNKKEKLKDAIECDQPLSELPFRIVHQMKDVEIYTDQVMNGVQ